jgi:hypothetical protein
LRRGLVLLLLAALTGIFPLAHASPPDPLWVGGIYDGADYDDVVGLLTSECVGKEGASVEVAWRPRLIARALATTADSIHPLAPVSALHLRSPPAA